MVKILPPPDKEEFLLLKTFLLEKVVEKFYRKEIEKFFKDRPNLKETLLILRGYFVYDILFVALSKRWKVEYGFNFTQKLILQSVPYRGKDLPAHRAQFVNIDIVILLTTLNYYYSGIDLTQLTKTLAFLDKDSQKSAKYNKWVESLPPECHGWDYPKSFEGVNLFNTNQINNKLFKIFNHHMPVINFWLDNLIFSKELQQFDNKLTTSSWDICEIKRHPVVGFSGTNDFRLLLPLNMKYLGLKELRDTNASLVYNLLLKENNSYTSLDKNCDSSKILKIISRDKCRVLLDAGALMIEFDNYKVAQKWLEILKDDNQIEAAVFFNQQNDLVVLEKNGELNRLEVSTFKNQLDKCVIYLDDVHTRGTDLKIPAGITGAVTLGKDLSKDKLMQACMRLRMLGTSHFVRFYASHEVDCIVKNKNIGNI